MAICFNYFLSMAIFVVGLIVACRNDCVFGLENLTDMFTLHIKLESTQRIHTSAPAPSGDQSAERDESFTKPEVQNVATRPKEDRATCSVHRNFGKVCACSF